MKIVFVLSVASWNVTFPDGNKFWGLMFENVRKYYHDLEYDCRRGLDWWLDLLITTRNYNAIADLHTLQVTAFTSLFLVTDLSSRDSSASMLTLLLHCQNHSHIATDDQSVSKSWYRAPFWGPWPVFFFSYMKVTVLFSWGPLSDERSGLSFVSHGPY
jgi:hypothetical protein